MTTNNSRIMMILALAIFAAYACTGCAGQQVKSFTEMTSQERATFFMKLYNAQYDDYIFWQDQVLTDEQRKVMREKKKVLTQVYPLIMTYNMLVDCGGQPEPEQAEAIMTLINKLLELLIVREIP